jgi:hypothetical protein
LRCSKAEAKLSIVIPLYIALFDQAMDQSSTRYRKLAVYRSQIPNLFITHLGRSQMQIGIFVGQDADEHSRQFICGCVGNIKDLALASSQGGNVRRYQDTHEKESGEDGDHLG